MPSEGEVGQGHGFLIRQIHIVECRLCIDFTKIRAMRKSEGYRIFTIDRIQPDGLEGVEIDEGIVRSRHGGRVTEENGERFLCLGNPTDNSEPFLLQGEEKRLQAQELRKQNGPVFIHPFHRTHRGSHCGNTLVVECQRAAQEEEVIHSCA